VLSVGVLLSSNSLAWQVKELGGYPVYSLALRTHSRPCADAIFRRSVVRALTHEQKAEAENQRHLAFLATDLSH